ncbi:MAG: DUF6362 family protein [Alphaproteobacteria bacterium]|nr:DUF6362 family protein [Alphaproteobacteria bacterium]
MKPVTLEQIELDLETAAYVERLIPPVHIPGYRNCMPEICYTPQEIAFMDHRPVPPRPTPEQIAIWEKVVLEWMPILEVDERKIVWKRAKHIPWKLLCREFGLGRTKMNQLYKNCLVKILGSITGKMCAQKSRGHFCKK